MAKKILDFYAELTVKADKYKKGLSDAKKEGKEFSDSTKTATSGILGLGKSALVAAGGVVGLAGSIVGAGAAVKKLADDYTDYAYQVEDVARVTGATVEEASRFIQVADDQRVSIDAINTALQGAIRKGLSPTIENLGKMSDEYLALEDSTARAKYLQDSFGRSGNDLARVMELSGKRMEEYGHAIDDTGLLMTSQGIAKAKQYHQAMDGLGDAIQGVKYDLTQGLMPTISRTAEFISNNVRVSLELKKTEEMLGVVWKNNFFAAKALHDEMRFGKMSNEEYEARLYELWAQTQDNVEVSSSLRNELNLTQWAMKDNTNATDAQTDSLKTLEEATGAVAGGFKNMGDRASGAKVEINKAAGETRNWINEIDPGLSNAISNAIKKLDFRAQYGDVLQETYEKVLEKIQENKISEPEGREILGGLFAASQALEVQSKEITFREAAENIQENLGGSLRDAYAILEQFISRNGQSFNYKVYLDYIYRGLNRQYEPWNPWPNNPNVPVNPPKPKKKPQAGLDMIIPPGFPTDNFIMGVSSGERVKVETQQQQRGRGGEGMIIVNNYNQAAAALSTAMIVQKRRGRLNASMG